MIKNLKFNIMQTKIMPELWWKLIPLTIFWGVFFTAFGANSLYAQVNEVSAEADFALAWSYWNPVPPAVDNPNATNTVNVCGDSPYNGTFSAIIGTLGGGDGGGMTVNISGGSYTMTYVEDDSFEESGSFTLYPPADPSTPCTFTITVTTTSEIAGTATAIEQVVYNGSSGGCSSCGSGGPNGSPSFASSSANVNSIDFRVNLGASSPGKNAGIL
jgi:hypothetical protein